MLWKEVWKETERGKKWFAIRDLLADDRCSKAVLDFLSTTEVWSRPRLRKTGRVRHQSGNSGSGENERRRREQKLRGWVLRSRNRCSSPRLPLWHPWKRSENRFLSFIRHSLGHLLSSGDRPGWRAKESLQHAATGRTAAGKRSKCTPP